MSAYSDAVLADAPIAYYRSADAVDASGHGVNLTTFAPASVALPANAASLIAGDANPGIQFQDGCNFWTSTAAMKLPFEIQKASISLWCKPSEVGGFVRDLVRKGTCYGLWILTDGRVEAYIKMGGSTTLIESTTVLVPGTRYHLAMTQDGTTFRLYVNGTQEASVSAVSNITQGSENFVLASYSDADHAFDGIMDEVAIFDKGLSAGRVQAHYLTGASSGATTTTGFEDTLAAGAYGVKARGLMAGADYKLRRRYLEGHSDPLAHQLAKNHPQQVKALTDNGQLAAFDAITAP